MQNLQAGGWGKSCQGEAFLHQDHTVVFPGLASPATTPRLLTENPKTTPKIAR